MDCYWVGAVPNLNPKPWRSEIDSPVPDSAMATGSASPRSYGCSSGRSLGLWVYSPRIWLWVYDNKISIHPIFYLLKGDCRA